MHAKALGFVVIAKVTLGCNLQCSYCYCSTTRSPVMKRDTLEKMLSTAAQTDAANVEIVWHGGEPMLAGLRFYQEVVRLQKEISASSGVTFSNAIQINGTLVTPEVVAFFREHKFKVGLSIDGYRELNDCHRLAKNGASVYDRIIESYFRLREGGVLPGVLAVLDLDNPPEPARFVDWLIELDCKSISFNLKYEHRMAAGDLRFARFLRALAGQITAKQWPVAVRELMPQLETKNVYDACHPGWPCHQTIAAVDEIGNIYFGCDRFMADNLHQSKEYVIGHVDEGFRSAFRSEQYRRLAAVANAELDACNSSCGLYSLCQGGCIADRMLLSKGRKGVPRWDAAYCTGQDIRSKVVYHV